MNNLTKRFGNRYLKQLSIAGSKEYLTLKTNTV